jgi:hypothetical protein
MTSSDRRDRRIILPSKIFLLQGIETAKIALSRSWRSSHRAFSIALIERIVRLGGNFSMEKEFIDRAKAIRQGILQLRDSL